MNKLTKLVESIVESKVSNALEEGLQRDLRVRRSMFRRLYGNKSPKFPNDPNRQDPGIVSTEGENIATPSERQSAYANAANLTDKMQKRAKRRAERIRRRIVKGGAGLKRMAAGLAKDKRNLKPNFTQGYTRIGHDGRYSEQPVGTGELDTSPNKRTPTDELELARQNVSDLGHSQKSLVYDAQDIRHRQRNRALLNRQARLAKAEQLKKPKG